MEALADDSALCQKWLRRSVSANDKANQDYYGEFHSIKDILFDGKVKSSDTATEFAKKLEEAAKGK